MNIDYLPYIVTEAFCILFAAVMFFHLRTEVGDARELASLKGMITAYFVMVATDMLWTFVENGTLRGMHTLNAVINGFSLSAVALGCYFWYQFVEYRLNPAAEPKKSGERLVRIPLFVICALDLSSVFTGWVFYISPSGAYSEGRLFWLQGIVTFAYLVVPSAQAAYRAVRTPFPKKRREYLTYDIYICVCFAVVAVEDYVPTIPLFSLSIFAVIQILFLTLYLDKEYVLAKKDRERTEANTAVMLSQLQPHFLFNALMAIQDMCHDKAPDAEAAVVEFAEYLRGNLDSLRRMEPIPFQQELSHTQNYLALESKRFAGKIHIEYDLRTERFSIPALTLQPIVENAVRYGVTQRVGGGTVRISSEERPGAYLVTVEDDGVGFDPENVKHDGRSHIGLNSVRSRLRDMCGGSLEVSSRPGKGTKVIICIPKGGAETT